MQGGGGGIDVGRVRTAAAALLVFVLLPLAPAWAQDAAPTDFDRARQALDAGDFALAAQLLAACREAAPNDAVVAAWLGSAQLKAGMAAEAVTTLQAAVDLAPRDPVVRNNLGTALIETGDTEGGMSSYRAALEIDPAFEDARYNLALALTDAKRLDEMLALYKPFFDDPQRRASAHLTVGQLLEKARQLRGAANHYQSAHTFDPSLSEATLSLARAMIALDETARAIELLQTEIAAGRATPALRETLGVVYQSQGRYAEAVATLTPLRDEGHDTFELHRALGMAQAQLGQLAEAAASFQRALGLRPKDVETENNLGWVYAQQLVDNKAEDHLVAALEGNPNLTSARKTLVAIYRRQGRTREVVAQLEAILGTDPGDTQALHALVRAALTAPEVPLAEPTLRRMADTQSEDPAFLGALGCLLVQRADYNGAARILTKAAELDPTNADIHNNLGAAHERLGLLEEALRDYRTASHLDPEHKEAQTNAERVSAALGVGRGTR